MGRAAEQFCVENSGVGSTEATYFANRPTLLSLEATQAAQFIEEAGARFG